MMTAVERWSTMSCWQPCRWDVLFCAPTPHLLKTQLMPGASKHNRRVLQPHCSWWHTDTLPLAAYAIRHTSMDSWHTQLQSDSGNVPLLRAQACQQICCCSGPQTDAYSLSACCDSCCCFGRSMACSCLMTERLALVDPTTSPPLLSCF